MKLSTLFCLLGLAGVAGQSLATPDGQALYDTHCATCHHTRGAGGIGLPLSASKLATVTDEYLRLTIREGRPGRIMPAFHDLSSGQIVAITKYIRSWSNVPGPVRESQVIRGDVQRGQSLYKTNCSACHLDDGSGKGLGTGVTHSRERRFPVMPPAINNRGFLASASDQMIKRVVMMGRPGTAMKSFLDQGLSDQDIDDIVSYVRSFENQHAGATSVKRGDEKKSLTLLFDSPYDFETTVVNLKHAIGGLNFRYFPDRYLEQGLAGDDKIDKRQMIIRYCNFNILYKLMRIEPRLGVILPCRITVLEKDDGLAQLVVMNMQVISKLFNNDQLIDLSAELQESQIEIIEETTL